MFSPVPSWTGSWHAFQLDAPLSTIAYSKVKACLPVQKALAATRERIKKERNSAMSTKGHCAGLFAKFYFTLVKMNQKCEPWGCLAGNWKEHCCWFRKENVWNNSFWFCRLCSSEFSQNRDMVEIRMMNIQPFSRRSTNGSHFESRSKLTAIFHFQSPGFSDETLLFGRAWSLPSVVRISSCLREEFLWIGDRPTRLEKALANKLVQCPLVMGIFSGKRVSSEVS